MATKTTGDFSMFSVEELKEKLRALGAKTSGNKAELISRLLRADPSCIWANVAEESETTDGTSEAMCPSTEGTSGIAMLQRELDITRKEQELAQWELELLRKENSMLRGKQRRNITEGDEEREDQGENTCPETLQGPRYDGNGASPKLNITSIAELLGNFEGRNDMFETWERQVIFLRNTYKLSDELTKVMMGSRLKGRALEWLHSRAEYITMPINDLLGKMRDMFHHRPNKVLRRKQFEQRTWRRHEDFSSYLHDKVIMANRIPIDEEETIQYVIEGIPDPVLRDQAKVQRLKTQDSLLEAFENISLSDGSRSSSVTQKNEDRARSTKTENFEKRENVEKREVLKTIKRCHNCGMRNHYAIDCPAKSKGTKCFECQEFGHIAVKCPKRNNTVKNSYSVAKSANGKYSKEVKIEGRNLTALIDTGSDLSLMRADEYVKLGAPKLMKREIKFRGIGSQGNMTLGEFDTLITIDDNTYLITICVVSDTLMQHALLIGTNFLNGIELNMKEGKISINKPENQAVEEDILPEIYQIDYVSENKLDLSHVKDTKYQETVQNLIKDYNPVKTRETNVKMNIILKDNEPVFQTPRRLSPSEREKVQTHVDEWLRSGIIQPSLSDYASPVVLVKKSNGGTRLCVDYRQLNKKILKVRFPLPLIEDQIDALQNAHIFSTLDLKNGFFHVPLEKESIKFTSFVIPNGQYEFLYVPFGLSSSPAIFQKFINNIFSDLIKSKKILVYVDDFIIFTKNYETGIEILKEVLAIARQHGLQFNWEKCRFLQTSIEFLGHIIENNTVRPTEKKIEAVMKFPQPTNVKQNQSFLGLTGYFRKYIPNYSIIARPLTNLLKTNIKFHFGEIEKMAFNQLKTMLCEKPILRLYDPTAYTELHTDASVDGYGAILLQRSRADNKLYPIYYASGKTTPAETRYTSYELEVLAIIKALRKFRIYLLGIPFTIITDCKAFSLTMSKKDLCVRVARWALFLEEFEYKIEHRTGKNMPHVDALSRNPIPSVFLVAESEESLIVRIRKAQAKDNNIQKILQSVNQERNSDYIIRDNLLFRQTEGDVQLVLPKSMQYYVVRQVHEVGHFATGKTEAMIKRDYWFPNMRAVIEKVLHNCVNCILAERKHGKQEGLLHSIDKGSVPLDTYHIDHIGPLPSTKKQYRHILVVVDSFSKFTWLYACRSTGTTEVLDKLRKQGCIFGNPRKIISDRGTSFTSHEFEQYCKEENIKRHLITTGVPRGNGQVERVNRTLIPLLSKMSAPKPNEWYKYLELCQKYLNATPHRSIGMTPFKLLFGSDMRMKEDPRIKEMIEEEWIKMFEEDRNELRIEAKEKILKVQQENKRNYDKRRKEARQFKEDDLVAIKRTQLGVGLKLASKFLGPYQVVKVLRNNRYVVRKISDNEGPQQTSTSIDHMKPWTNITTDYSSSENEEESNMQDIDI